MFGKLCKISGKWRVVEGSAIGEVVDDLHPFLAEEAFNRNVQERTDIDDAEKARLIDQGFERTRWLERHGE